MKKVLLSLLVVVSLGLSAQDLTSKKGENYLPESGDWAIGFDATSFLNYAGNLLNAGAVAPTTSEPMLAQTIYGKIFTDDNQAYRLTLGINMLNDKVNTLVDGLESDGTTTGSMVTDEVKTSTSMIALGLGKEYRRGSTRLQGLYGAEAMIMLTGGKTQYTYGNTIKSEANAGNTISRPTEVKNGGSFGFILRGFVGAEYFIAPKIAISAEYGWGIGLTSNGGSSISTETYDLAEDEVNTDTNDDGAGSSDFSLANDLGISSGMLGLILHF
jgi:hypothetical protein